MRWKIRIPKRIIALILICLLGTISLACESHEYEEKTHVSYLYLYEKDPVTWNIVANGSWGKMEYRVSEEEFEFAFHGYKLNEGQNYSLIYYPDPWPGEGLICLGNGTVNQEGEIHIAESVDIDILPIECDETKGVKIWLVLSNDINFENSKMIEWNPMEYLFEHNLLYFSKIQIEEPSEKYCKETKNIEKEKNESKNEENKINLVETGLVKTNWLNILDKLIEKFPILEDIIRLILEWIYNKLVST
jgi:hypothetical protein